MENTVLPEKEIMPLSFSDAGLYHSIPELKAKRFFALGETVHGSESFVESALQLIKHQVKYNNCKLILLELPVEMGLSLNRFVQGDESFEIDSLLFLMKRCFNVTKYKDMLLWLKEYNRHTEKKVWLMGIDIEHHIENSMMSLFDYLYTMNQSKQQLDIDTLCHRIILDNSNLIHIADSAGKNAKLKSVIGEKEFDILIHCLNISDKISRRTNLRLDKRDSVMYENVRFLEHLLCEKEEKIFIYAHLGHTSYKSSVKFSNSRKETLGFLMKQEYGEAYFVAGLFVGRGFYSTVSINGIGVKPMQLPPSNSLEYFLNKTKKDYFYLFPLPDCTATIRLTGNAYRADAFEAIALRSRMDAAFYIRESQATVLFPDISPDENAEIMERFSKCIEKDKLKFPHKLTR